MGTVTRRELLLGVPVVLGTVALGGCSCSKQEPVDEVPQTPTSQPLSVVESSWMRTTLAGSPSESLRWVIILKNPNEKLACLKPKVRIVASAADGTVVGSVEKSFQPLAPLESMAFAEEMACTQIPASLSIEVMTTDEEGSWIESTTPAVAWGTDALTGSYDENSHLLSYTGWVSNPTSQQELLLITVAVRDAAGVLIDGSSGTITVPAGQALQFELLVFPAPQNHASAEVFVHRF